MADSATRFALYVQNHPTQYSRLLKLLDTMQFLQFCEDSFPLRHLCLSFAIALQRAHRRILALSIPPVGNNSSAGYPRNLRRTDNSGEPARDSSNTLPANDMASIATRCESNARHSDDAPDTTGAVSVSEKSKIGFCNPSITAILEVFLPFESVIEVYAKRYGGRLMGWRVALLISLSHAGMLMVEQWFKTRRERKGSGNRKRWWKLGIRPLQRSVVDGGNGVRVVVPRVTAENIPGTVEHSSAIDADETSWTSSLASALDVYKIWFRPITVAASYWAAMREKTSRSDLEAGGRGLPLHWKIYWGLVLWNMMSWAGAKICKAFRTPKVRLLQVARGSGVAALTVDKEADERRIKALKEIFMSSWFHEPFFSDVLQPLVIRWVVMGPISRIPLLGKLLVMRVTYQMRCLQESILYSLPAN